MLYISLTVHSIDWRTQKLLKSPVSDDVAPDPSHDVVDIDDGSVRRQIPPRGLNDLSIGVSLSREPVILRINSLA